MRQWLCLAVSIGLVMLGITGVAQATSTRIQSLGSDGDFFEDDFNVLRWYASLPGYDNMAVLELGDFVQFGTGERQTVRQGAGVHANLDGKQRWGIVALYVSDVTDVYQVPGTLDLLWARRFGAVQTAITYQWTLLDEFEELEGGFLRAKESNSTLGLALRWDLASRFYLDLVGDIIGTWRQYDSQDPDAGSFEVEQRNVWQSYAVRGRAFWGVSDKVALVPLATHLHQDHLTFQELFGVPGNLVASQSRIGLGMNVFPNTDNLLIFSYEYRSGEEEFLAQPNDLELTKYKRKAHSHRVRVALESRLLSWLTLRGGAMQVLPDINLEAEFEDASAQDPVTAGSEDPTLDLTLGLGFHFGDFDADLAFNDEAPFDLGHILTGSGNERDSNFTSITLKYLF